MRRQTVIHKLVEQLGEAGYYVLLPSATSKVMRVSLPHSNVTVRGVHSALSTDILEALEGDSDHPIELIPVGSAFGEGSAFTLVRIRLPL